MSSSGGGYYATTKTTVTKPKNKKHLTRDLISVLYNATSAAHSFLSDNDLHLLPSQTLTLEALVSSTSISLTTLLSLLPRKPLRFRTVYSPPQPHCWFHRFLIAAADNHDPRWLHAFRMSMSSFSLLLGLLFSSLETLLSPIPPNYALAAALYRLAHGASYKAVSRRFGLDSEEVCRAFYTVCKLINENLGYLFEFQSDIERIVEGFWGISLPNCCGVLGFGKFEVDGELLGTNGAVMVQALVDSEGRFLDVSAGWPSTMKPQTILHQTKLFSRVEESKELLNGPVCELNDGNLIPQYVIGDGCFPLLPWVLTPYIRLNEEDSFSSSERGFNLVHSRGMELISIAFGGLGARWQLLSKPWKEECLDALPFIIITGCLLHNFLIKCNEPMPDENAEYPCEEELSAFEGEVDESGQQIRDAIASYFNRGRRKVLPNQQWKV